MTGYRQRVCGDADIDDVLRFVQRVWTPASRWAIGDLTAEIGFTPDAEPEWRLALWEYGDTIVGWAWHCLPDSFSLIVDPAHPALCDVVLDWAVSVVGGPIEVDVLDSEQHMTAALRRRGLAADLDERFYLSMLRDLSDLPAPVAGVEVRAVRPGEIPVRAALHRAVWNGGYYTDEVYAAMAARWPYRREFDLVAVVDGQPVSYVLGWWDEVNRLGQFEPVGTLREYRRRGLARALCIAAMRAFRAAGGEQVVVNARGDDGDSGPHAVYAGLGFRQRGRIVTYRGGPARAA